MATYAGRSEQQKALPKLYSQLCYRFSRHEVWQDFIWMAACAISNAVDRRYAEERETQYMRIVQKYDEKERQVVQQLFGSIVDGMEAHPDCDFLGELYMELELGNKHGGQFFTPYSLCQMMARCGIQSELVETEMARQGYISIDDCACGAGAMLVAAANYLKETGFDYQRDALFVAQDIDSTTALMCYIQLSLLGCAGYVVIGDTLSSPQTGHVLFGEDSARCWYTPMFFHEAWVVRRSIYTARSIFGTVGGLKANPDELPRDGYTKPAREAPATFTVATTEKHGGQLKFDFGG